MKNLILVFLTLLSFCCKANEIDKLKTIEDVNLFLKKVIGKKWDGSFFDVKPDSASKALQIKFFKLDINNDGLTDLILNGENIVAVVDNGKGDYDFHLVNEDGGMTFKKFALIGVDTIKPAKIIIKAYYRVRVPQPAVLDTLIVKFGGFIEYNRNIDSSKVAKISFSTTPCFGECPIFDLFMQSDGTAEYIAHEYNTEKGRFNGIVEAEKRNEILSLVVYINLRNLNNNYKVNWTDDQACTLTVKYKGGAIKTIYDYGKQGTFGLRQLYHLLFSLRKSQEWTEVNN